ncbi:hypothetical protein [Rhodococcus sp. PD04]|uniref:hypothetical protein n=1 Tax=Rhodococcus sp. PD04 TaxID=3109594 RepID=UPI002DD86789|nr:hypothetical protein [Rhodococcus sp. PD04]WSE22347.1 hypothetical protein U9J23_22280 [Rhodococcus sp. PD04]
MRIRSTKPEFWRSETIASLDWESRLVLKGIESYVDDNGVGKDSVVLICADVFPHDLAKDPETVARVSRALRNIAEANLIVRYTVDGDPLLYVRRWKAIQRIDKPAKGRFPRPDGTLEYRETVDETVCAGSSVSPIEPKLGFAEGSRESRESVANVPENYAPGTGEQGNRGTGEEKTATRVAADPTAPLFPVDAEIVEPEPKPAKTVAKAKPAKAPTPEHIATTNAYERTRKGFSFLPARQIAKAAIHDRGESPARVEEALVGVHELGKPITKQTVSQWLDGTLAGRGRSSGPSRQDDKVRGYLEVGERVKQRIAAQQTPSRMGELEQ